MFLLVKGRSLPFPYGIFHNIAHLVVRLTLSNGDTRYLPLKLPTSAYCSSPYGGLKDGDYWLYAIPVPKGVQGFEILYTELMPVEIKDANLIDTIPDELLTRVLPPPLRYRPIDFKKVDTITYEFELYVDPSYELVFIEPGTSKLGYMMLNDLPVSAIEGVATEVPVFDRGMLHGKVVLPKGGELRKLFLRVEADPHIRFYRQMISETIRVPKNIKYLIPQSHIDVAWLWPESDTKIKVLTTLGNVLNLQKQFDFKFILSTPLYLEWLESHNPQYLSKVRSANIEPVGAMLVEADVNLPLGETILRQLMLGKQLWHAMFNTHVRIDWLLDSFGYPRTLPKLYKLAGIDFMFTAKLDWRTETTFPYRIFRWRGDNGSEIVVLNGRLREQLMYLNESDNIELLVFGRGDAGGGPTIYDFWAAEIIEATNPITKLSTIETVMKDIEKLHDKLPVWDDELYIETHRATYTTGWTIKHLFRMAERKLLVIEKLYSTLLMHGVTPESMDKLPKLWHQLLKFSFHDILCGTIVRDAREQIEHQLQELNHELDHIVSTTLRLNTGNMGVTFSPYGTIGFVEEEPPLPVGKTNFLIPQLQVFDDKRQFLDAWNIRKPGNPLAEISETHDTNEPNIIHYEIGHHSSAELRVTKLSAGLVRLDLQIDWHDRERLLKLRFPLKFEPIKFICGKPYGCQEYPVQPITRYDKAKWEVCFIDWLVAQGASEGTAIISAARNGVDFITRVPRVTITKGPLFPDPTIDTGRMGFTFWIYGYEGDWLAARIPELARRLLFPRFKTIGKPLSFCQKVGNFIVEAIRPSKDGFILHLFEPYGRQSPGRLMLNRNNYIAYECDLWGNPLGEPRSITHELEIQLNPFEVKPIKLIVNP